MTKKKISFSDFDIDHLDEVLPLLKEVLIKFKIDFFILGALARDINLLSEGFSPVRITKDVDIAAFIPKPKKFDEIMEELVKSYRFNQVKTNPVRLVHESSIIVDILPFNQLTSQNTEMIVFGSAFANFNLKGLNEVFENGIEEFFIENDDQYSVVTPAAIILLKFLAYNDKPDWRLKDLEDIAHLFLKYFDLNETEIFEHHNDLFENDRDLQTISARVIGRKLRLILAPNDVLKDHFLSILKSYVQDAGSEPILVLSKNMEKPPEDIIQYLVEILIGIEEG